MQAQSIVFSSGFENWNGNTPTGWMGFRSNIAADSVLQYSANVHGGSYAVELKNPATGHKRFSTQDVAVDSGTTYTINFWVRGQGNIRTGLFDGRATSSGYATYNSYINVNSTTWIFQTQDIVCVQDTSLGQFIFSVQSTVAAGDHIQIDDVTITEPGAAVPTVTITAPVEGSTVYATSALIQFTVNNFIIGNPGTGIDGHVHYYLDGNAMGMIYAVNPVPLTGLSVGNHVVVLQLVDNSNTPLVPNRADTVNFVVNLNPPGLHTIYDVQYTQDVSGNSPLMDSVVSVYGIVTGTHSAGYFIQDGDGAWNGVYVYDPVNHPALGDSVIVRGIVAEYYNLTEIKSVSSFSIISSGNQQPTPAVTDCAGVNAEENEGVLVTAHHVTCTVTNAGFGMWKIEDQSDTAKVHNLMYAYSPVLNEMYDVTGPVYYSFNEARVEPRSSADVVVITGIGNSTVHQDAVILYPNPANGEIHLNGMKDALSLMITNMAGQLVLQTAADGLDEMTLDIQSLEPGNYFVKITGKQGETQVKGFIKE